MKEMTQKLLRVAMITETTFSNAMFTLPQQCSPNNTAGESVDDKFWSQLNRQAGNEKSKKDVELANDNIKYLFSWNFPVSNTQGSPQGVGANTENKHFRSNQADCYQCRQTYQEHKFIAAGTKMKLAAGDDTSLHLLMDGVLGNYRNCLEKIIEISIVL